MEFSPADIPPNHTIYVQNLNEKIKKDALKRDLLAIFSQFGEVMEIVALKTLKMRGQAFIVFKEINSATTALKNLNGFPFYGKEMRINYAKSKSDVISRMEGTFVERPKTEKRKRPDDGEKKAKKQETAPKVAQAAVPVAPVAPIIPVMEAPTTPNHVLFIQNLPAECTELMLSVLFKQYPGFKEARMVPGRPGIAFVEYDNEIQSSHALMALNGFLITNDRPMSVTFAKR
eukprot:TRINITY_DN557_c0_g4_i1.p1 TRINITY_DN557_c0_g4~~TRINITY_DN557_c0_g4_i1.p1  ORF type:complete len:231 (+),score=57.13 TRINITY_DN557_c0_g4_i1:49-741(+)